VRTDRGPEPLYARNGIEIRQVVADPTGSARGVGEGFQRLLVRDRYSRNLGKIDRGVAPE